MACNQVEPGYSSEHFGGVELAQTIQMTPQTTIDENNHVFMFVGDFPHGAGLGIRGTQGSGDPEVTIMVRRFP